MLVLSSLSLKHCCCKMVMKGIYTITLNSTSCEVDFSASSLLTTRIFRESSETGPHQRLCHGSGPREPSVPNLCHIQRLEKAPKFRAQASPTIFQSSRVKVQPPVAKDRKIWTAAAQSLAHEAFFNS